MISDYQQPITWLRLAVIAVIALASRVTSYDGCSVKFGRRGCGHRVVHGVSVVCNGHHVETVVPYNIPADTVHLTLVSFNLTRLTKAGLDRFANVQCLTVSDSLALTEIDSDAFSGLGSLVELTLDATNVNESQLAFIADESFANVELLAVTRDQSLTHFTGHGATRQLHALRSLDLKHCAIEHLSSSLYHELRRLERLDLTGNKLSRLNWTQIGGHVTHLNSLLLAGNRLQTLPLSAHGVLYTVKELSLGGNPLHCNCQLHWLRDFYQQSAVDKTMDAVRCVSPEPQQLHDPIRGQRKEINFKCVGPEAPVIVWTRHDSDHRVELNCTSRGDPSPTLKLRLPDGRVLISPPSERMSDRLTTSPQLLIRSGLVTCQANNSEGSTETSAWVGPQDTNNGSSPTFRRIIHRPITVVLLLVVNVLSRKYACK